MPEKTQPSAEAMRAARAIIEETPLSDTVRNYDYVQNKLAKIIDRDFTPLREQPSVDTLDVARKAARAIVKLLDDLDHVQKDRQNLLALNAALRAAIQVYANT